jgi:N-acetylglucosaminyldiphosphoundecaprenol N-acetyl-beta-D-mannosaminyltransferase
MFRVGSALARGRVAVPSRPPAGLLDDGGNGLRAAPVLDTPSLAGDIPAAARAVVERARAREGGYVCLCNVHVLVLAQRDPRVRQALESAWAVLPDGWPVAWLQRRAGVPNATRIAGMELLTEVFELGGEAEITHFLFGSSPEVLLRMEERLAESFPDARVVGSFSPPYGELDEVDFTPAVDAIHSASPDIVWCGLGAPKQELWMQEYAPRIAPALVLGVGAAFDFTAGTKRRAPRWAQKAGLEWLHRLVSEPRRLVGRYATTGSLFAWYAAAWLVSLWVRRLTGTRESVTELPALTAPPSLRLDAGAGSPLALMASSSAPEDH